MTDSNASMLMRWKIASRRMPALFTTPSSLPKLSIAVLTILLAGIASATLSKFATAVPPRFLISSTTSSAGEALDPDPSAATPGSLTTTLAPSAAQSSAISRPIPRPAPVTMIDLPSSDLAIGFSGCRLAQRGRIHDVQLHLGEMTKWLAFVSKNDRAARREHAANAVANRNFCISHLRRCDAAHLAHTLLQRVHAIHARMHVAKATAVGIERQLAAGAGIAIRDELASLFMRHEAEIAESIQRQMREGIVDHQVIDILVGDAGLLERQRPGDLEGARAIESLHLADHRRLDTLAGAENVDRLCREVLGAVCAGED